MSNDNTLSQIIPLLNSTNFSYCENVTKGYTVLPINFCFKCIFTVLSSLCKTYRKIETFDTVIFYTWVRHHFHKIKAGTTQRYIARNILYIYILYFILFYILVSVNGNITIKNWIFLARSFAEHLHENMKKHLFEKNEPLEFQFSYQKVDWDFIQEMVECFYMSAPSFQEDQVGWVFNPAKHAENKLFFNSIKKPFQALF